MLESLFISYMKMCIAITFGRPLRATPFFIAGYESTCTTIRTAPSIRLTIIAVVVKQILCFQIVTVGNRIIMSVHL